MKKHFCWKSWKGELSQLVRIQLGQNTPVWMPEPNPELISRPEPVPVLEFKVFALKLQADASKRAQSSISNFTLKLSQNKRRNKV